MSRNLDTLVRKIQNQIAEIDREAAEWKKQNEARLSGMIQSEHQENSGQLKELKVTPTKTRFVGEYGGVALETEFITPALPDDADLMSMPVTLVSFKLRATDGKPHNVKFSSPQRSLA